MSREIKRVPLDFDWPTDKIWHGYCCDYDDRQDPPTGEGWQMWETVSEGSPVSPVFPTSEELAQWLTTPEGGEMAGPSRRPLTIEQARGFVGAGWAPSMVGTANGLQDGAAWVGDLEAAKARKSGGAR